MPGYGSAVCHHSGGLCICALIAGRDIAMQISRIKMAAAQTMNSNNVPFNSY